MPPAERSRHFEDVQEAAIAQARQLVRERAVRRALDELDPRSDDQRQEYPEVLRRLASAIDRELKDL